MYSSIPDLGGHTSSPVRTLVRYVLWVVALAIVAASIMLGPGRLYGIACSRDVTGEVMKILPFGRADASMTDLYLVELHAGEAAIPALVYLVPSNDPQWLLVNAGERVCVRLYPTAPWTTAAGPWQNALLVAKLMPPPTVPVAVAPVTPVAAQSPPPEPVPQPLEKLTPSVPLPSRQHGARIAEPWDKSMGILYSTSGVYWLATKLPADLPQRLDAGRLLVEEGIVELDFDSGAKLVADGPSELEVISDEYVLLGKGKLVADVPDDLVNFMIATPGAAIYCRPHQKKDTAETVASQELLDMKSSIATLPAAVDETAEIAAPDKEQPLSENEKPVASSSDDDAPHASKSSAEAGEPVEPQEAPSPRPEAPQVVKEPGTEEAVSPIEEVPANSEHESETKP